MKRRRDEPAKVSMVVDTFEGKVLGWQRGDQFVPIGENCCENPFECKRCFGPWPRPPGLRSWSLPGRLWR